MFNIDITSTLPGMQGHTRNVIVIIESLTSQTSHDNKWYLDWIIDLMLVPGIITFGFKSFTFKGRKKPTA